MTRAVAGLMQELRAGRWSRAVLTVGTAACLACSGAAVVSSGAAADTPAVQVKPAQAQVAPGTILPFVAAVTGSVVTTVTWRVQETSGCGAITSTGVYTAPSAIATCHVVAVSTADANISGSATVSIVNTPPSSGLFLNGFFPLAVDGPDGSYIGTGAPGSSPQYRTVPQDFDYWKGNGINTIARGPQEGANAAYDTMVHTAGLHSLRAPLSPLSSDAGKTYLLAWAQPDEPDAAGGLSGNMATLRSNYQAWKAADATRQVYVNFGGSDLIVTGQDYATAIQYADWIAEDVYPYTGVDWNPSLVGDPTAVGKALDKIASLTSKPKFAWIETSDINVQSHATGPSGPQVRVMIWNAINHGVRGIIYWTEQMSPWIVDAAPVAVAEEMALNNAIITALSSVLQDTINPSTVHASSTTAAIDLGWRDTSSGKYFFAVNTGSTSLRASISLTGIGTATSASVYSESRSVTISSGTITDDFAPYDVHIYVVN